METRGWVDTQIQAKNLLEAYAMAANDTEKRTILEEADEPVLLAAKERVQAVNSTAPISIINLINAVLMGRVATDLKK